MVVVGVTTVCGRDGQAVRVDGVGITAICSHGGQGGGIILVASACCRCA